MWTNWWQCWIASSLRMRSVIVQKVLQSASDLSTKQWLRVKREDGKTHDNFWYIHTCPNSKSRSYICTPSMPRYCSASPLPSQAQRPDKTYLGSIWISLVIWHLIWECMVRHMLAYVCACRLLWRLRWNLIFAFTASLCSISDTVSNLPFGPVGNRASGSGADAFPSVSPVPASPAGWEAPVGSAT